jgi:hypothetical protein
MKPPTGCVPGRCAAPGIFNPEFSEGEKYQSTGQRPVVKETPKYINSLNGNNKYETLSGFN